MKMRLLTLTICLACVTLLFTACSSREPATPEAFTALFEASGFTVEQGADSDAETFIVAYTEESQVVFLVYASPQDAARTFESLKSDMEDAKGSGSTTTSVEVGSYSSYKLTTGDLYFQVCRIDGTVLMATTPKSSRDEIQSIIKELGY